MPSQAHGVVSKLSIGTLAMSQAFNHVNSGSTLGLKFQEIVFQIHCFSQVNYLNAPCT